MSETQQASNWNLPNVLTTLRIIMVPLFVWLMAGGRHLWGGFAERTLVGTGGVYSGDDY